MDNQTSVELECLLRLNGVVPGYVPPNNHRSLKAERVIRVAKNYLTSTCAGAHSDFPMKYLERTFEGAEITLNHANLVYLVFQPTNISMESFTILAIRWLRLAP